MTATTGSLLAILAGPWSLFAPASLLFPLLLWLGYRCRPVFAAAAVFTIAAAIVWTTTNELGRYGDPGQSIAIRVVAAQLSMLGFALAALVSQRCLPSANELRSANANWLPSSMIALRTCSRPSRQLLPTQRTRAVRWSTL